MPAPQPAQRAAPSRFMSPRDREIALRAEQLAANEGRAAGRATGDYHPNRYGATAEEESEEEDYSSSYASGSYEESEEFTPSNKALLMQLPFAGGHASLAAGPENAMGSDSPDQGQVALIGRITSGVSLLSGQEASSCLTAWTGANYVSCHNSLYDSAEALREIAIGGTARAHGHTPMRASQSRERHLTPLQATPVRTVPGVVSSGANAPRGVAGGSAAQKDGVVQRSPAPAPAGVVATPTPRPPLPIPRPSKEYPQGPLALATAGDTAPASEADAQSTLTRDNLVRYLSSMDDTPGGKSGTKKPSPHPSPLAPPRVDIRRPSPAAPGAAKAASPLPQPEAKVAPPAAIGVGAKKTVPPAPPPLTHPQGATNGVAKGPTNTFIAASQRKPLTKKPAEAAPAKQSVVPPPTTAARAAEGKAPSGGAVGGAPAAKAGATPSQATTKAPAGAAVGGPAAAAGGSVPHPPPQSEAKGPHKSPAAEPSAATRLRETVQRANSANAAAGGDNGVVASAPVSLPLAKANVAAPSSARKSSPGRVGEGAKRDASPKSPGRAGDVGTQSACLAPPAEGKETTSQRRRSRGERPVSSRQPPVRVDEIVLEDGHLAPQATPQATAVTTAWKAAEPTPAPAPPPILAPAESSPKEKAMAVGGGAGAASKPSFTKENSAVPTATEPSSPTKPDKAEVQRRVEEEKRRVAAAMEERRKASAQRKNTAPVAGAATGEGPKRVASPSKAAARLANGSKPAPPPSSTPSKVAPATTGSVAGETRVPSPPRVGHTTNPTPAAGTDPVNTSHDSSSRGKETSEDGTGSAGPSGSVEPASRANTKVSPVRRRQRPRSRNNRPTSMLTSQVLFDNGHGTMEQEQTQPQRRRISRCRNTPKTVMTNIPVDAHMPHMNYRSHGSLGGSSSQPAQSAPQRELKAALDESPPDRPLFGAGRASNGGYLSGSESGGTNSLTSPMRSGRGNGRQELGIVSPKPLSDIRPLPTLPGNSPQANSLPASRNPRRSPNDAAKVGLGFRRIGTGEATEERSLDADHLAATTLAPLPSLGRPQRPSVGV